MKEEIQDIIVRVPFEDVIERAGFNSRTQFGDMDGLKASLLSDGWNDAVSGVRDLGTDGKWLLGPQGHRRRRAICELIADGQTTDSKGRAWTVPIKEEDSTVTEEERRIQIITLNTGKPLELIEEARVFGAIVAGIEDKDSRNEKIKELAEKTGRSRTHIVKCLSLLEAPKSLQKLVEKGNVAGTTVIELFEDKKDWGKVETGVLSGIAKANSQGKTKLTKKQAKKATDAAADNQTKAEQEAAEKAKEEEKAAKEAQRSRTRELIATEKRTVKLSEEIKEWNVVADEDARISHTDSLITDAAKRVASYLLNVPATKETLNSTSEYAETSSVADIRVAFSSILKQVKQVIKDGEIDKRNALAEVKKEHAEEIKALKAAHKEAKKKD